VADVFRHRHLSPPGGFFRQRWRMLLQISHATKPPTAVVAHSIQYCIARPSIA